MTFSIFPLYCDNYYWKHYMNKITRLQEAQRKITKCTIALENITKNKEIEKNNKETFIRYINLGKDFEEILYTTIANTNEADIFKNDELKRIEQIEEFCLLSEKVISSYK